MAVPLTFGFVISDVISVLLKYPASKKPLFLSHSRLIPLLIQKVAQWGITDFMLNMFSHALSAVLSDFCVSFGVLHCKTQ